MNKISTLSDLKAYALRRLGNGVINIEITIDQQNDLVDDAIQMFSKYHFEGFSSTYALLQVTAGQDTFSLDDDVLSVRYIIPRVNEILSEPSFSVQWEFMNEKRWIGDIDLVGFELLMEKMKMIDIKFRLDTGYTFNQTTHQIQFIPSPEDTEIWALAIYKSNDPYDFPDIYNNDWLKKYVVALFREQWGDNLTKYTGVPLPGGSTLNGDAIRTKGENDRGKLEDELKTTWTEPILPMIG
jgi:hypothetical protein